MDSVVISSTGYFVPPDSISNDELVNAFNAYANQYNNDHCEAINEGRAVKLPSSSADFIFKASGIKTRRVIDKKGILKPDIMHPLIAKRHQNERSLQCEMSFFAAEAALAKANKKPSDIDAIIVACSVLQRPYPGIAIELQAALGATGFALDLTAGCSSASFGINMARSLLLSNSANCILVVNPEIYTAHLNFKDRKSHFIFGDGCSAAIIEKEDTCISAHPYKIISSKMQTQYSNNIRNNFGFLSRCEQSTEFTPDNLFTQNGKKVREEVVPIASEHILDHLSKLAISPHKLKRLWLHQANINMNKAIAANVLGRTALDHETPMVLAEYGNTGAAGVLIAFDKYHEDLTTGDLGILCSFGAGYTVGSVILEKL